MSLNNLISIKFSQQELTDINKALDTIEAAIKGKMVNLTPEERQQYGKLNNKTENWISKIKGYMEQKPDLIPFYLDKDELDKDMDARHAILPMLKRITALHESLGDTAKLLSTDIYNAAIAYYRNIKLIAKQNVPGTTNIYQDLAAQFPGRSSSVPEEPANNTDSNAPNNM